MKSSLRTTMPADSILAHYSNQLVAGGWKQEGRPTVGDGVGVQRFSFREGPDPWVGTLIVIVAADHSSSLRVRLSTYVLSADRVWGHGKFGRP